MLALDKKQEIIAKFRVHDGDTGSPEVQIAILTERINYLTEHLKVHKKRSSLQAWLIKDGRATARIVELLESKGYSTLPGNY